MSNYTPAARAEAQALAAFAAHCAARVTYTATPTRARALLAVYDAERVPALRRRIASLETRFDALDAAHAAAQKDAHAAAAALATAEHDARSALLEAGRAALAKARRAHNARAAAARWLNEARADLAAGLDALRVLEDRRACPGEESAAQAAAALRADVKARRPIRLLA